MNFDRASRAELLNYIESQKDKLFRYEQRLKDIIHAYKSVSKEKEALESCVKALSGGSSNNQSTSASVLKQLEQGQSGSTCDSVVVNPADDTIQLTENSCPDTDTTGGNDGFVDPLGITGVAASTDEEKSTSVVKSEVERSDDSESRVLTLTTALATLNHEKSKIDANYIAEKRILRQQYDDLSARHDELQSNSDQQISVLQEQLNGVKQKVRDQQQEREQEQNVHQIMLREIQRLLADERKSREISDEKLMEKDSLLCKYKEMNDLTEHYRSRISSLETELERFRDRLSASEESARLPSPMMIQLQQELAHIQAQHRIQLEREQQRATEAEMRINTVTTMSEERVSSLEDKLSKLSEIVATYEKSRMDDQNAIQKLRDRINQLDLENAILAKAATTGSNNDSNLDVDSIQKRIEHFKQLLNTAQCQTGRTVSSDDLNVEDDSSREDDPVHEPCRQELRRLKEEFEHYKNRAQCVLRSKNSKETISLKEIETLKNQVPELTEKLRHLRTDALRQHNEHEDDTEKQRQTLTTLKDKHKKVLAEIESRYQLKIGELEKELHKQRERSLQILADKQKQIEEQKLRLETLQTTVRETSSPGRRWNSGVVENISEDVTVTDAVSNLIQIHSPGPDAPAAPFGVGSGGAILHYVEEQARRDQEITQLRKQKTQLEQTMRQIQETSILKQQSYMEELDTLRSNVSRHERNKNRESANLEYLKNVVLCYLQSQDYSIRQQMLNTIAAVLEFSPAEKSSVEKSWSWWGLFPPSTVSSSSSSSSSSQSHRH